MRFIEDTEINLEESDYLNTIQYVKTLSNVIENAELKNGLTIGMYGEWGSGKSSIIFSLKKHLEKNEKIKFIIYDAWKYSHDSFRRTFLQETQKELKYNKKELSQSFYSDTLEEMEMKNKFHIPSIAAISIISILGLGIIFFWPQNLEFKLSIVLVINVASSLISFFRKSFYNLKLTINKPHLFAPEQFEECFDEMLNESISQKNLASRISSIVTSSSRYEKIIFVIDNIDRCNYSLAYELLATTKNFLGKKTNTVFIIPVDNVALAKHISSKTEESGTEDAEEFLRKIFNVTLRLNKLNLSDIYDFAKSINDKHNLNFSPVTIDIISKEYATNPRRIIQAFNNLLLEIERLKNNKIIGTSELKEYESIIAKILIIREEWPEYYQILLKNPDAINAIDSNIRGSEEKIEKLNSFLRTTNAISKSASKKAIERLISNTDKTSEFGEEFNEMIKTKDIEKIQKFYEKQETNDKKKIFESITYELNKSLRRGLYTSDSINLFEILLSLNENQKFTEDENLKIEAEIGQFLAPVIPATAFYQVLVQYAFDRIKNGHPYLIEFIKGSIKQTLQSNFNLDNVWFQLFKEYIKIVNINNHLNDLEQHFHWLYLIENVNVREIKIPKESLGAITPNSLIEEVIKKFTAIGDEPWHDLVYLNSQIKFGHNLIIKIISKISGFVGSQLNVSDDRKIDDFVSNINLILNKVENKALPKGELNNIFNLIVNLRDHNGMQLYYTAFASQSGSKSFLQFLYNIFRISNNTIDTSSLWTNFVNHNESNRESSYTYIELLNNDFVIQSLIPLLNKNKFTSSKYLDLFIVVSNEKDNKETFYINEAQVSPGLNEILDRFLLENESDKELSSIFLSHISKERLKKLVVPAILNLPQEKIENVRQELLTLAFDKICEDLPKYEGQPNLLKQIAAKGSESNIDALCNIIIAKLQYKETILEGLEIISVIKVTNKDSAQRIINELKTLMPKNTNLEDQFKQEIASLTDKIQSLR
ncbi:KAP family P-loop NTPase fold protein [Leptospira sarikeiensis]|uniref:KAP NTPase domain-containing protein n=1 Tax=Leptospira sarikeiensis TaxID=2484943 RepID=A0A4R9KBV9_9LEPT|nr:P-loop NTPase fold protein [Leptospira sarikeiensis]TGL63355.1 hypothetical protein EHQ64_05185 [Leptospira sarikeiensis]